MGQKVHPIGFRLGVGRPHDAVWYAEKADYREKLISDLVLREYIFKTLRDNAVARVETTRKGERLFVVIHSARPATLVGGRKGERVELLSQQLAKVAEIGRKDIHVEIRPVDKPDANAVLIAYNVAQQLERRVMFRRAMRRAVQNAMRASEGVRIQVSGRLGGAEIARTQWVREGRVPLHRLRADLEYGFAEAHTTYGVIGVKVWVFHGDRKVKHFSETEGED